MPAFDNSDDARSRIMVRDSICLLSQRDFELIDVLDFEVVHGFRDKDTAKKVVMAIGLTTWRYVKMDGPKYVVTLI